MGALRHWAGRASATTATASRTSSLAFLLLLLGLLLPFTAGVNDSCTVSSSSQPVGSKGMSCGVGCARTCPPNVYTLGFLYDGSPFHPKYHVGAMAVAVDKLNNELLANLSVKLEFLWRKTDGSHARNIQVMTEFREMGVHGFIGPGHTACLTEAIVATAWNIPLISYLCQDRIVDKVEATARFVRTFPPRMKVVGYIKSIMSHYGWNRTVIIYSALDISDKRSKSPWQETVDAIKADSAVEVVGVKMLPYPYFSPRDHDALKKMFDETKDKTRIYIFLADHDAFVDFVRYKHETLQAEGREAEYAVLAVTEKPDAPNDNDTDIFLKWEERNSGDPRSLSEANLTANITAFRNVFLLCYRAPADMGKYREFMKASLNKSIEDFNVFNVYKFNSYQFKILMPEATYLYDAVYLYGRTLVEALKNGTVDIRDGLRMIEMMKDRPYPSIRGYSIHIDGNGNSMANYSVYTVMKQDMKMTKIAQFSMSRNNSPEYKLTVREDDIWIDKAPKSIPACGLDGSECLPIDWRIPVLSSIGAVTAIVAVALVFLCRHYRYEQKLASLLWKIDFRDLVFTDNDFNDPLMSEKPKDLTVQDFGDITQRRASGRLVGGGGWGGGGADDAHKDHADGCANKYHGIRVATIRGSLVAVRVLRRRHVEVTRAMRKELHLLKELQHDNINRFIGAFIDTPNIGIVTQYCSRGSLKDILENDDIHLDDMFIASLVFDLIRGMIFLHDSEIGSHGNLKSTNCLVDSRWVLQIADFGIHHLRGCELPSRVDEETYYGRLLWRAPELLRMLVPPPAGTQRGDVYSFGIILFEIHGRAGPWGPTMYSASEIVEKVKFPPDGAMLRPDTSLLKCEEFIIRRMKECWREIPECRPDFKYIRMKLKPMQRGLKSNIFDNMMAIMEKYADNLEAIVAARTDQLMEEKKKTEALLLRMLPKVVAEQLKLGNPVVPEHYNAVTIYFSDVVGFTAISAESTPLEVVDMLNDLYTTFDSIIGEYDVYKVETIGDAYMVVSGLPIRNGDNHAGEIASMSLHLLRAIGDFRMRHRPDQRLSLRIGLHSGSVVAGVVGLKMPRYCLFGDTVNTASRMESNGEPMKIHCSDVCKNILTRLGGYILEERGYVNMKGKGEMFTYYVLGEDKSHRLRRISVEKRPISMDAYSLSGPGTLTLPSRFAGSTPSLRSVDSSSAAATESLRLLLNGNVPSLSRDVSGGSLESQV